MGDAGGGGTDADVRASASEHATFEISCASSLPAVFWAMLVGVWHVGLHQAVSIQLKRGKNVLRFSHKTDVKDKGFTIKQFQLAPRPK